MGIYQSMQRVRFSSPDGYLKFLLLFGETRNQLKTLPGFLHLTWWVHPKDPTWFNEVSMWTSFEALKDWHMNTYHKAAKEWAVRSGAIMEDIITNFAPPASDISSPSTFGVLQSAQTAGQGGNRTGQLALRMDF